MNTKGWRRILPRSISGRMTLVLFLGIVTAQLLGSAFWARQIASNERQQLEQMAENLGA